MKIYIILECDRYKSWSSFKLRAMTTNRAIAESGFNRLAPSFVEDNYNSCRLILASYTPKESISLEQLDENLLRTFDFLRDVS